MRLSILVLILFFSVHQIISQDSTYKKKKLTKADIQVFYSHYSQDGDHSAITGGIGTEELKVNDFGLKLNLQIDTSHLVIFETYFDVISSASTDNIDFIKSSASEHDNHITFQLGYQYSLKSRPANFGVKYLFGLESDYFSNGFSLWTSIGSKDFSRSFSATLLCFFDDLRWGRLSPDAGFKPTTLIYPAELRYKQWFDIYMRYTYNLSFGLRQDINRKLSFQADAGIIYQDGLLSTPYHRVYFVETDSAKVENLPRQRFQIPLGAGLNTFLTNRLIMKFYYRFYWDTFGVIANTFTVEAPIKLGRVFAIYPNIRLYSQTGSYYFKPFKQHSISDEFYTPDYDLSSFWSYKVGIGFGFFADAQMGNRYWSFNNLMFRYSYYHRSDELHAHMLSLVLNIRKD